MIGILAIVAVVGIGLLIAILVVGPYLFPVATINPDANITMIEHTYHVPLAVASAYYTYSTQQLMSYDMEKCTTNGTDTLVYWVSGDSQPSGKYTYFDANGTMLCSGGNIADRNWVTEGTCPQTLICTDIIGGGKY